MKKKNKYQVQNFTSTFFHKYKIFPTLAQNKSNIKYQVL